MKSFNSGYLTPLEDYQVKVGRGCPMRQYLGTLYQRPIEVYTVYITWWSIVPYWSLLELRNVFKEQCNNISFLKQNVKIHLNI